MALAETAKLLAVLELKDLFSDKISRAEKSLNKFESRSTKAGRQIGLGILRGAAVAGAGVAAFGTIFAKGLGAASDLNETVSKTGVVFGKNAKAVLDFGKDSASSLGLSQNAALAAAATYGNLFVSLGLTQGKAATMSTTMVKLAGDLASFNNASPEDTLLAIQAGLVGETEPLRRYGINLNDATLRQEAMRLGLTKTTKEVLPPAIKAQAAYSLILKQSGTAQGDFKRTSGGMANQIRILKANFTDMLATLASPALPGVAKIFQNLNKEIKANQPAIAALGDKIGSLFTDANIKSGFDAIKQGFQIAKDAAPAIADAAKITGAALKIAVDAFKSLPKEVQQIAIAGLAVNKLTGGLVTNIAGGIIDTVGKQFLQRGGTPANPLFVSDVSAGVGNALGSAGGAAGAAGGIGGLLKGGVKLAGGIGIAIIGIEALGELIKATSTTEQLAENERRAIEENRRKHGANVTPAGGAAAKPSGPSPITAGGFDSRVSINVVAGGFDRRITGPIVSAVKAAGALNNAAFRGAIGDLKKSTKNADIAKAVANAVKVAVTAGRGGVAQTKSLIASLQKKLGQTHDPKLQAAIRTAIAQIRAKLPNREYAARLIERSNKIIKSSDSTGSKIKALQAIERDLKDHKLPGQARAIQTTINQMKTRVAAASKAAGQQAAFAIRDKKLSTNLTIPITNVTTVNSRSVVSSSTKFGHYFATADGNKA